MKKTRLTLALVFSLALLASCKAPAPAGGVPQPGGQTPDAVSATPGLEATQPAETPQGWTLTRCRIVDGVETGNLLLAGEQPGEVYLLNVADMVVALDGGSSSPDALKDGMLVDIGHGGMILETFPAQFASARTIGANTEGLDDLSGLYLQVLEDLWTVDNSLNADVTQLGVDLSGLEGLTDGEKAALAYAFGMAHGIMPVTGTWEELKAQGYFADAGVSGLYQWEKGCLFTVEGNAQSFSAEKWRSPLGAYFYQDCAATLTDGVWSYTIGGEAIA